MSATTKLGAVMAVVFIVLLIHEQVTGYWYIRGVGLKLMVMCGLGPGVATAGAAMIVLGIPLIACMVLLALSEK